MLATPAKSYKLKALRVASVQDFFHVLHLFWPDFLCFTPTTSCPPPHLNLNAPYPLFSFLFIALFPLCLCAFVFVCAHIAHYVSVCGGGRRWLIQHTAMTSQDFCHWFVWRRTKYYRHWACGCLPLGKNNGSFVCSVSTANQIALMIHYWLPHWLALGVQ